MLYALGFGKLLLLLADMLLVSTDQCKSGIFNVNPDKIDTKLDGYRISTFENISPRGCFDKCIRRPRCHSYNYNRHALRCELNYQPPFVSSSDFLNEVGFNYVVVDHKRGDPLYDTCLGNPCNTGEICEGTNDGGVFCVKEHEEINDCTNLKTLNPENESGVYTVYPSKTGNGLQVFCDMSNVGWTVIQRRINGSEDFRRSWVEYENGFGDLQHEFWLGNKNIHILTSKGTYRLRVELVDRTGSNLYAEYSTFVVDDASNSYRLTVSGYDGNAGNAMVHDSGYSFSTFDHDVYGSNCAYNYGAWWYSRCSSTRLNYRSIDNLRWNGINYVKSKMMIQRIT